MHELLDLLGHPSRWNSDELAADQRVLVALLVLALTAAVATVSGIASARWVRRRDGAASDATARAAGRVARGFSLLVGFVGVYWTVELLPLPPRAERLAAGATFIVAAWVGARLVIHLVALLVGTSVTHVHAGERERLEREYVPLAGKLTTLVVGLVLVIVVAKHFGQDVTSLVAALGVGSLAIGLAAQQTLGNMIAGVTLLMDRPFRPGDRIQLATGESGEVLEIGVRSTKIVMPARNLLIVPNAELVNSRVINFHHPTPASRGEVRVTVGYGSDVERVTQLLVEMAAADVRVAKNPPPGARVAQLANVGIEIVLGYEVTSHTEVPAVEDSLRREILKRFAAEKIDLPFPRTDVFLLGTRST